MGFFETLFPEQPRGRSGGGGRHQQKEERKSGKEEGKKRPPNKRRRSRSLEKLTASFAQASIERAQRPESPASPSRPASAVPIPPSPTRHQVYRQELPLPEPHQQARPAWEPSARTWRAPQPSPPRQPLPTYGSLPFPTNYPSAPAYPPAPSPYPSYPPSHAYTPPPDSYIPQPIHHHVPPAQSYSPRPAHSYTPPSASLLAPPRPRPHRPISAPTPPSPSVLDGKPNQCRGTTSSGKRCTRFVGVPSPTKGGRGSSPQPVNDASLASLNRVLSRRGKRPPRRPALLEESDSSDSEADDEEELPKFCHQHSKQAMDEPGTFAGSRGTYVKFDDWIPAGLPPATKLQLRYEMARPPSQDDKPGYIYVHEMAHTSRVAGPTTLLKLGRSVKPVARLSQWKRSCPSRIPIVRGLFPIAPGAGGATLGGALAVSPAGAPFHHRWERLVLIEAAGRAKLINPTASGKRGKCGDCGKRHCELFEVERGAYERWVIELVERWQRWCTTIL